MISASYGLVSMCFSSSCFLVLVLWLNYLLSLFLHPFFLFHSFSGYSQIITGSEDGTARIWGNFDSSIRRYNV